MPLLSVVIPVFNRETLVTRAIRSALADPGSDIEVLVVDDGSTDGTSDAVLGVLDERLRLVRHGENRGRCRARNTGARAAEGSWLVFLDSDDELVPGGLEVIRSRIRAAGAETGKLLFMCRDSNGMISPEPSLDGRVIDYLGYVRWLEETSRGRAEALACCRRSMFLEVPYPEGQHWQEGIHELDFARRWLLQLCPDVVRLYHHDAENRVMKPDLQRLLAQSADFAEHAEAVLLGHGPVLAQVAPRNWAMTARQAAMFRFLNGNRLQGARHAVSVLRRRPLDSRCWMVLVLGLIGRHSLAKILIRRWTGRAG